MNAHQPEIFDLNQIHPSLKPDYCSLASVEGLEIKRPQDFRVGKYFLLSDFLYTFRTTAAGIPNLPEFWAETDEPEIQGMMGLCQYILDPVVEQFGQTSISFGYCSPEYYEATNCANVDGELHSFRLGDELIGGAVDIVVHRHVDNPRLVAKWIRDNCIFHRVILYPSPRPAICVAWTSKPKYYAKEWLQKKYITLRDSAA